MLSPDKLALRSRTLIKRAMYAQMQVLDAVRILLGRAEPKVSFVVKDEPASVYFNFRVREDMLEAFEKSLDLPGGFEVCPIRCLQDDAENVVLTLNVYEVSGITSGIRAEWSTYVRDDEGKPRYMVVEAQSSTTSMDPVDVVTRKGVVEHEETARRIRTYVKDSDGGDFTASITKSKQDVDAAIHGEWIEANDYIYWRNGVCDRCFYDAGMGNPRARVAEPARFDIDDRTHWAQFVEPQPLHVVRWECPIGLTIMPWYGL